MYACHLSATDFQKAWKNPHTLHFFCNDIKVNVALGTPVYNPGGYMYVHERIFSEKEVEMYPKNEMGDQPYFQPSIPRILDEIKYIYNYEPRGHHPMTTLHWGQLKLFLTVYQFLSEHAKKESSDVVLYVGSSPGENIVLLAALFPWIEWYLVDPRAQDPRLAAIPSVKMIDTAFFDDEYAANFRKTSGIGRRSLLFISDIRVADEGIVLDTQVDADNRAQERWIRTLRPRVSSLKFRLPRFLDDQYTYVNGTPYLQMYAPHSSTETRLIVHQRNLDKNAIYSLSEYEGRLWYFNRVIRASIYPTNKTKVPYLDRCYDCSAFRDLVGSDAAVKNIIGFFKWNKLSHSLRTIQHSISPL